MSEKKSHQCSICLKRFPRPSKLQYHIAYHHEKKFPFECSRCGKAYSNQDHVNRHFRNVHQRENLSSIQYHCEWTNCGKTFVNKQNLDRHIRTIHQRAEKKPVKCFYCDEFVSSLDLHLIEIHQSSAIDQFKCLDCSKVFPTVKRLIHHRIIHTDERRRADVQCTIDRLLDEIERKERIYQCDLCQREFRSLFHLDQHRHSPIHQEKQYRCSYPNCDKVFPYLRNLRQHIKVRHEDSPRLLCPIESCSKSYTCQSSLSRHFSQSHTPKEILHQVEKKRQCKSHRSSSIRRFLSGFNNRKLNERSDLAERMRTLLKLLSNEENVFHLSDPSMEIDSTSNTEINPTLLEGYRELGVVEL